MLTDETTQCGVIPRSSDQQTATWSSTWVPVQLGLRWCMVKMDSLEWLTLTLWWRQVFTLGRSHATRAEPSSGDIFGTCVVSTSIPLSDHRSYQTSSGEEDEPKMSKLGHLPSQALLWVSSPKVSQVGNGHSRCWQILISLVVTSVGMELSQVLTKDQRKERFSHSLQQKRAHKQMGEEANLSLGILTSRSVAFNAKAPKLETRTLLQKFLDAGK